MTDRKSYSWNPSGVTPDKGYGPPIWETPCIFEVNRAKKVKSGVQVGTNNNSGLVGFSLGVAGDDGAPNSNLSTLLPELSKMSRAVNLIFSQPVNIDKPNSRTYHVSR